MYKFFRLILILVAILAIFPLYARYKASAGPIPPGVHLGGLHLAGIQDPADVRDHLEAVYLQPIAVQFGDTRLALRPEEVDLHIEVEQMLREAEQYLDGAAFMDIAVRQALGYEQQRREVPLRFVLNSDKLRAWLETAASEHNSEPGRPRLAPPTNRWSATGQAENAQTERAQSERAQTETTQAENNPSQTGGNAPNSARGLGNGSGLPPGFVGVYSRDWTWQPGRPGLTLDVDASIPRVVAALTTLEERTAHLAVDETPPAPPQLADLEAAINDYLNTTFPGFGAVFIEDLTSGETVVIDADVAFSGMSTLKIAIATAAMRALENGVHPDDATSVEMGQWIDYALGDSNNYAANLLLSFLGNENRRQGAQRVTEFMRTLGYANTFMQSGYEEQGAIAQIPTPANQQTEWNTNPDPHLQTTAREMGRFLADLFHCSQGEGPLLVQFPGELTPDECSTVLFYMTHDEFQEMIWAGLPRPDNSWILHKHGFAAESHSDVALVWSHSGPYVISIFLWREGWMDWFTSNRTMKTISRMTWNFFEFRAQQTGLDQVPHFTLSPPPGYKPIPAGHIPVVARGE